jgi:flagellar biosynthesis regulator FlaF
MPKLYAKEDMAMEKRYYDAGSLDRAVRELEREYDMTSEAFYEAYAAGAELDIPHFNQHVWASFHEDILRLTDGQGVERGSVMARVGQAAVASCA